MEKILKKKYQLCVFNNNLLCMEDGMHPASFSVSKSYEWRFYSNKIILEENDWMRNKINDMLQKSNILINEVHNYPFLEEKIDLQHITCVDLIEDDNKYHLYVAIKFNNHTLDLYTIDNEYKYKHIGTLNSTKTFKLFNNKIIEIIRRTDETYTIGVADSKKSYTSVSKFDFMYCTGSFLITLCSDSDVLSFFDLCDDEIKYKDQVNLSNYIKKDKITCMTSFMNKIVFLVRNGERYYVIYYDIYAKIISQDYFHYDIYKIQKFNKFLCICSFENEYTIVTPLLDIPNNKYLDITFSFI